MTEQLILLTLNCCFHVFFAISYLQLARTFKLNLFLMIYTLKSFFQIKNRFFIKMFFFFLSLKTFCFRNVTLKPLY